MCPRARRREPAFAEPCYMPGWLTLSVDSPLGKGGTMILVSQVRKQRLRELTLRQTLDSVTCLSHGWQRPGVPARACLIPSWVWSLALCCLWGSQWGDSETQACTQAVRHGTHHTTASEATGQALSSSANNHAQAHREPFPGVNSLACLQEERISLSAMFPRHLA